MLEAGNGNRGHSVDGTSEQFGLGYGSIPLRSRGRLELCGLTNGLKGEAHGQEHVVVSSVKIKQRKCGIYLEVPCAKGG